MLPAELLSVWKRKGHIQPKYAKLTPENLKIAQTVINEFKNHIGHKKKNLKVALSELEESYNSYRFIRGLATLLERKSIFRCESGINPERLRMQVFKIVDEMGIPTTSENRRIILEALSESTGLTVNEAGETSEAVQSGRPTTTPQVAAPPAPHRQGVFLSPSPNPIL